MKSKIAMIFCSLMIPLVLHTSACAQEEKKLYWYEVSIIHGPKPYEFYGSSTLNNEEFIAKMSEQKFIRLDNLMFRMKSGSEASTVDTAVYKNWKEWDAIKKTYIYLNVGSVVAVHPLEGNPASKK